MEKFSERIIWLIYVHMFAATQESTVPMEENAFVPLAADRCVLCSLENCHHRNALIKWNMEC